MSKIDENVLSDLQVYDENKVHAQITKEIIKNLFSDEDTKIIQNTEFDKSEMPGIFALELINHFLVKRFCYDKFLRDNFQSAINKLYLSRVSLKRQGRTEMFDSIKTEAYGLMFGGSQQPETVK